MPRISRAKSNCNDMRRVYTEVDKRLFDCFGTSLTQLHRIGTVTVTSSCTTQEDGDIISHQKVGNRLKNALRLFRVQVLSFVTKGMSAGSSTGVTAG